jgi:pimeloyl-ACP methyl ester carboxylesterase
VTLEPTVSTSSGEQFARCGEIDLCYETFGSPDAPPLLLVMGLAAQMVLWDDDLCEQLAGRGFWVIRFDNRDVGRSTILMHAGVPTRRELMMRDRRAASYRLADMAGDAAGLLDHLDIPAAHVVGASMGGMIGQQLAIDRGDRVRSLVSIMSTTGNRRVGQPSPVMIPMLLRRPARSREAYIADFITTFTAIGSRTYRPDPARLRRMAERCWERGYHPGGTARQLMAIQASPNRTAQLRTLRIPVTVIHGNQDRLVMRSGGRATAKAIPGAKLLLLDGMGHDMPPVLWPQIVDAIAANAASASNASSRSERV